MIRVRAGQREQCFDRIQPIHRIGWLLDFPAFDESSNVDVSVLFAANEIAVERNNHLGVLELVVRRDGFAKRNRGRLPMNVEIHRFVSKPAGLGKLVADQLLQPSARGRTAALQQKTQPLAAAGLRFPGQLAQKIQRCLAPHDIAVLDELHRAVGIVKVEEGSLRVTVRGPVAVRVQGVAFDFCRAAVIGFDHQRNSAAARWHRGGEELRQTVDVIFRRFAKRQNLFLRAAATAQAKARQEKRGGHDFHEMPARNRVGQFAGARWKLPLHPTAKLRRVGQLIQAAPVFRSGLAFRAGRRNGFAHR